MIWLKDLDGTSYVLSKDRLRSVSTKKNFSYPWYVFLKDIQDNKMLTAQLWMNGEGPSMYCRVYLSVPLHTIGCRKFGAAAFARILKAIKAAK